MDLKNPDEYEPPFSLTRSMFRMSAEIAERVGALSAEFEHSPASLRLHRINRVRTIRGSLAIEGNTLDEDEIVAIIEGRHVAAPPREIREVRNALAAYDMLDELDPASERDLLRAHGVLMAGLQDDAGHYRQGGVGVISGASVTHVAPPPKRVPLLMGNLLGWFARTDVHPLLTSAVFHYEFEFIHPFSDGNGRMGRLWQSLILTKWNPVFKLLPVENIVFERQEAYYRALMDSTAAGDSAPFVEFMLASILDMMTLRDTPQDTPYDTPQDTPYDTPQVEQLLSILDGERSVPELMQRLGLRDRKSFMRAYIKPALEMNAIERTLPDKPTSRHQRYRAVK